MSEIILPDTSLTDEETEHLARYDWLTGILNRPASELAISAAMENGGVLFACDLDGFKEINDRYGHLTGDEALKTAAQILCYVMRGQDIVGRIGGDEFVIFAAGQQTEETIALIRSKIYNRFSSYNEHNSIPLGISIGAAMWQPGDSYASLFARADQQLYAEKASKKLKPRSDRRASMVSWQHDIDQIIGELTEEIHGKGGAYCQSYESFKTVFRYLERIMRRNDRHACLLLMSLTNEKKQALPPEEVGIRMHILDEVLESSLRLGDVYTRYSGSQFLVLLTDISKTLAETVARRLRENYYKALDSEDQGHVLLHYSYQLSPARILGERRLPGKGSGTEELTAEKTDSEGAGENGPDGKTEKAGEEGPKPSEREGEQA